MESTPSSYSLRSQAQENAGCLVPWERDVVESNFSPDYLEVRDFGDKGKGLVSLKEFRKGEYVVCYNGEHVETPYNDSFTFEIGTGRKKVIIDATNSYGFAKYINDDHHRPNLKPKALFILNVPHVVFFALRTINVGDELVYSYGDDSSLYPWRKVRRDMETTHQESPKEFLSIEKMDCTEDACDASIKAQQELSTDGVETEDFVPSAESLEQFSLSSNLEAAHLVLGEVHVNEANECTSASLLHKSSCEFLCQHCRKVTVIQESVPREVQRKNIVASDKSQIINTSVSNMGTDVHKGGRAVNAVTQTETMEETACEDLGPQQMTGRKYSYCVTRGPSEKEGSDNKKSYFRHKIPCVYCQKDIVKAKRHYRLCHRDIPEIKNIFEIHDEKKQSEFFRNLHKQARYKKNKINFGEKRKATIYRQRHQSNGPAVACLRCYGIYSRYSFSKHKCKEGPFENTPMPMPIDHLGIKDADYERDFVPRVLTGMRMDDTTSAVKANEIIMYCGNLQYKKCMIKKDKEKEAVDAARRLMRHMTKLHMKVQEAEEGNDFQVTDLFNSLYFTKVMNAVNMLSQDEQQNEAYGAKLQYGYLLKKTAKYVRLRMELQNRTDMMSTIDNFLTTLQCNWPFEFGKAESRAEQRRSSDNRLPSKQTSEETAIAVVQALLNHIKEFDEELPENMTASLYVDLRSAVVTFLTIVNGKRGGEVGRLTLDSLKAAKRGEYTRPGNKGPDDENILVHTQNKGGKNTVPFFILAECRHAVSLLVNRVVREKCTVSSLNRYVFASTGMSLNPVTGWNEAEMAYKNIGIEDHMHATVTRHYVATQLGRGNPTDAEARLNAQYMGHSLGVHQNVYQAMKDKKDLKGQLEKFKRFFGLTDMQDLAAERREVNSTTSQSGNNTEPAPPVIGKKTTGEPAEHNQLLPLSSSEKSSPRRYYRWNAEDSELVFTAFQGFIMGPGKFPGRYELQKFLAENQQLDIHRHFQDMKSKIHIVGTKIRNEKKLRNN